MLNNMAAKSIREAIKTNGYKHCHIARKIGLPATKFSELLNGGIFSREVLEDLAEVLHLDQKKLLIENAEYKVERALQELNFLKNSN